MISRAGISASTSTLRAEQLKSLATLVLVLYCEADLVYMYLYMDYILQVLLDVVLWCLKKCVYSHMYVCTRFLFKATTQQRLCYVSLPQNGPVVIARCSLTSAARLQGIKIIMKLILSADY